MKIKVLFGVCFIILINTLISCSNNAECNIRPYVLYNLFGYNDSNKDIGIYCDSIKVISTKEVYFYVNGKETYLITDGEFAIKSNPRYIKQ